MEILRLDARSLLSDRSPFPINLEVQENAESLVGSHLRFLGEFYESKEIIDPNNHICLVILGDKKEIIAYRYFYYEPSSHYCELFAVYVANDYRGQGFSKHLFREALKIAGEAGCKHFTIRFGSPTEERAGLVEYYKKFASCDSNSMNFRIYYGGKQYDY